MKDICLLPSYTPGPWMGKVHAPAIRGGSNQDSHCSCEGPGRGKFVWVARYQDSSCSHGVGGTRTGEVRVGRKDSSCSHGVGGTRTGEVRVGRKDSSCSHGVGGTRTGEVRVSRKTLNPARMGWEGPGWVKFV